MVLRSDINVQEANLRVERAKNSILGKNFSEEQPFRGMGVNGYKMATLFVAIPHSAEYGCQISHCNSAFRGIGKQYYHFTHSSVTQVHPS